MINEGEEFLEKKIEKKEQLRDILHRMLQHKY